MTLAQDNIVPIIVALLVGLVVAWVVLRRSRKTSVRIGADTSAPTGLGRTADDEGDNGLADEGAAAVADVAGQLLGVDANPDLPPAEGAPDRLETMKGVGPRLAAMLNEKGITRFDQVAALTPGQVEALDAGLGAFKGRLARDRVVEQASYLARGDTAGFEAAFGKLGSAS